MITDAQVKQFFCEAEAIKALEIYRWAGAALTGRGVLAVAPDEEPRRKPRADKGVTRGRRGEENLPLIGNLGGVE